MHNKVDNPIAYMQPLPWSANGEQVESSIEESISSNSTGIRRDAENVKQGSKDASADQSEQRFLSPTKVGKAVSLSSVRATPTPWTQIEQESTLAQKVLHDAGMIILDPTGQQRRPHGTWNIDNRLLISVKRQLIRQVSDSLRSTKAITARIGTPHLSRIVVLLI